MGAAALKVKKKFRELIPPLGKEEFEQLERNIIADGCRDPIVVWGKIKSDEFEPIQLEPIIVDGHNRYSICTKHDIPFKTTQVSFSDDDDACIWIIRNQFGRRNITLAARCQLAEVLAESLAAQAKANQKDRKGNQPGATPSKLTKLEPIDTRAAAAKEAGVSTGTLTTYRMVKKHATPEVLHELHTKPEKKLHRVAKEIRETQQREARKEKRVEAAKSAPKTDERIILGDFREHAAKVADGSVSLIFTDPPYDRQASKMLPELAEFAAAKLADGGSLICYVGQTQLPSAIDAFRQHLRYWWTIACVHKGRATVMREYGINAGWKAVLWFVKGTRDNNSVMVSDVMSGGEEKTHHDWQQSQSEAEYWISVLTERDGLVCDPFLGGGTTAAAAEGLGRQWIGFEIDEDNARICSQRIAG